MSAMTPDSVSDLLACVAAVGRSLDENIHAVGDVVGAPALASTGSEQGRLAACHMFGVEARSIPALYAFGIYAILEIAWWVATRPCSRSRRSRMRP